MKTTTPPGDRDPGPAAEPVFMDFLTSPGFRKYFANTSWMMGEKLIRTGVNFVVGIFIARKLGPGGYGLLSYGLSIVALFGIISSLGLYEIIVRNLVREPMSKNSLLGTTFGLRFIGAVLILILAPLTSYLINPEKESFYIVLILAFGPVFQSILVIDYYFQSRVQLKYSSIALGISFGMASFLKIILLFLHANVFFFAAAYLFEYIVMAGALVFMYKKQGNRILRWAFHGKEAFSLIANAAPMIFSGFLIIVYSRIDQVMIKSMLGNDAVGNYSVAVTMTEAWQFIPAVLTASLFPAIIEARKDLKRVFDNRMFQLYSFLFWLSVAVALPVSLASGLIIEVLFGSAYTQSSSVLSILIWNCVFIFLQLANAKWIIMENIQKIWLAISPIGCLINVAGNFFLIGRYGIQGAAVATLVTQFVTSHLVFAFTKGAFPIFLMQWRAVLMPFNVIRTFIFQGRRPF